MELKGDMNLQISDADFSHIKILLSNPPTDFGGHHLQFKHHPNVLKFSPGQQERVVALKDSSRAFPLHQSIGVLKWRYAGTDESNVPLSSMFFSFHGMCYSYSLHASFSQLLALTQQRWDMRS